MKDFPMSVLFLCTGNSARSVLGEFIMNSIAGQRFKAVSAGADPKGQVHPMTLRVLREFFKIDPSSARSESWEVYKDTDLDIVITVCDNAKESCPVWPGQPIMAHWSSPDPAAFVGDEEQTFRYFRDVGLQIQRRIQLLNSLPLEKLDRVKLAAAAQDIGTQAPFE